MIVFSAAGEAARESVLEAGADLYLPKPLRLDDLLRTIRRLVGADRG